MKKIVMEGDIFQDYLLASSPQNDKKFVLKVNQTQQQNFKAANQQSLPFQKKHYSVSFRNKKKVTQPVNSLFSEIQLQSKLSCTQDTQSARTNSMMTTSIIGLRTSAIQGKSVIQPNMSQSLQEIISKLENQKQKPKANDNQIWFSEQPKSNFQQIFKPRKDSSNFIGLEQSSTMPSIKKNTARQLLSQDLLVLDQQFQKEFVSQRPLNSQQGPRQKLNFTRMQNPQVTLKEYKTFSSEGINQETNWNSQMSIMRTGFTGELTPPISQRPNYEKQIQFERLQSNQSSRWAAEKVYFTSVFATTKQRRHSTQPNKPSFKPIADFKSNSILQNIVDKQLEQPSLQETNLQRGQREDLLKQIYELNRQRRQNQYPVTRRGKVVKLGLQLKDVIQKNLFFNNNQKSNDSIQVSLEQSVKKNKIRNQGDMIEILNESLKVSPEKNFYEHLNYSQNSNQQIQSEKSLLILTSQHTQPVMSPLISPQHNLIIELDSKSFSLQQADQNGNDLRVSLHQNNLQNESATTFVQQIKQEQSQILVKESLSVTLKTHSPALNNKIANQSDYFSDQTLLTRQFSMQNNTNHLQQTPAFQLQQPLFTSSGPMQVSILSDTLQEKTLAAINVPAFEDKMRTQLEQKYSTGGQSEVFCQELQLKTEEIED